MCGRDVIRPARPIVVVGSAPRVRERPELRALPIVGRRFSPACAGETKVP